MRKDRLDKEFTEEYAVFLRVAGELCNRYGRAYSSSDCVHELYFHLLQKEDEKVRKVRNYGISWLNLNISKSGSSLNYKKGQKYNVEDFVFVDESEVDGEQVGSEIDKLKERLNNGKNLVKDRINYLFLHDIAGDVDFTRKGLAEYYNISVRSVGMLVTEVANELKGKI